MSRTQHPLEIHRFEEMVDEGLDVHELDLKGLLIEILIELRRLNIQMEILTDNEVEKC